MAERRDICSLTFIKYKEVMNNWPISITKYGTRRWGLHIWKFTFLFEYWWPDYQD